MNDGYNFNVKRKRPEEIYDNVLDYFNEVNVVKYASSKSMRRIQKRITLRALELLHLEEKNSLILDAGCGPGFASSFLKEIGYKRIIALDLIKDFLVFLDFKVINPIVADMCFLPFRPKKFDAIISISSLQWIYRDVNNKNMESDIINLIKSFYHVLKKNYNVLIQFYPKNKKIMDAISRIIITKTPFKGNFIIDNPDNSKKRKIYLLLRKE